MSLYPSLCARQRQTDGQRQTGHIWGATNGRLPSHSVFPPLSSHPERGSGEVGVVGQTGQLCDHSVCTWEGGRDPQALLQSRLHTGPHRQLLHSQRTLQELCCDNMSTCACVPLLIQNQSIYSGKSSWAYKGQFSPKN